MTDMVARRECDCDCGRPAEHICGVCNKPKCDDCWNEPWGADWCADCQEAYDATIAERYGGEQTNG